MDDKTRLFAKDSDLHEESDGSSPVVEELSSKRSRGSQRDPFIVNADRVSIHRASQEDLRNFAVYNRYKYYAKLDKSSAAFNIPDHVLPRMLFFPYVVQKGAKQSSLVTIFAIWNTMMGTSLLSLPWAMQQSGFALGIGLIIVMAMICLYTCLLIVKSSKAMGNTECVEFVDVCGKHLGRAGKWVAFLFGILAFLGAIIVYWVLLSNFLFKVGKFVHDHVHDIPLPVQNVSATGHVLCSSSNHLDNRTAPIVNPGGKSGFYRYWDQRKTVPLYLLVILLPLSSLKSATFFTKFNALGTISVLYIIVFVVVKSSQWGFHLHLTTLDPVLRAPLYSMQFPAMAGILALALYIHNAVLSILATNEKPENNVRDVSVAYILATATYFFVGVVFYACFPLDKMCLDQVFLNNFPSNDMMTFVAQCGLLLQMVCVFPLLTYIVRIQVFQFVFDRTTWGYAQIILINSFVIALGVCFAMFYPEVGHIIRYVGSASGCVYIFTLPCLIHMFIQRRAGTLSVGSLLLHSVLLLAGVVNVIGQFLIT